MKIKYTLAVCIAISFTVLTEGQLYLTHGAAGIQARRMDWHNTRQNSWETNDYANTMGADYDEGYDENTGDVGYDEGYDEDIGYDADENTNDVGYDAGYDEDIGYYNADDKMMDFGYDEGYDEDNTLRNVGYAEDGNIRFYDEALNVVGVAPIVAPVVAPIVANGVRIAAQRAAPHVAKFAVKKVAPQVTKFAAQKIAPRVMPALQKAAPRVTTALKNVARNPTVRSVVQNPRVQQGIRAAKNAMNKAMKNNVGPTIKQSRQAVSMAQKYGVKKTAQRIGTKAVKNAINKAPAVRAYKMAQKYGPAKTARRVGRQYVKNQVTTKTKNAVIHKSQIKRRQCKTKR